MVKQLLRYRRRLKRSRHLCNSNLRRLNSMRGVRDKTRSPRDLEGQSKLRLLRKHAGNAFLHSRVMGKFPRAYTTGAGASRSCQWTFPSIYTANRKNAPDTDSKDRMSLLHRSSCIFRRLSSPFESTVRHRWQQLIIRPDMVKAARVCTRSQDVILHASKKRPRRAGEARELRGWWTG